jgi:hypothetical protein
MKGKRTTFRSVPCLDLSPVDGIIASCFFNRLRGSRDPQNPLRGRLWSDLGVPGGYAIAVFNVEGPIPVSFTPGPPLHQSVALSVLSPRFSDSHIPRLAVANATDSPIPDNPRHPGGDSGYAFDSNSPHSVGDSTALHLAGDLARLGPAFADNSGGARLYRSTATPWSENVNGITKDPRPLVEAVTSIDLYPINAWD